MPLSDRYSILFEPIRLGPKWAKNRFWQTPHASGFGSDHPSSQAKYRETKAEGGWGVVFTEATSIAPEVDKSPAPLARLWDDGDVRNLRCVAESIQKHGALAGIELEYHSSIGYMTEGRGLLARGVDPVPGDSALAVPYAGSLVELEVEDIEELKQLHVESALRAKEAGFDLITLHCGHAASLLAHFLIPYYNTRTDEYGGSFENRIRFTRETLHAVREAVGNDVAVGMRFGVDTLDAPFGLGDRGIRQDGEAPQFIEAMDDLVDYWDLVIGGFDWAQDAQSSRTAAENHEAKYVAHLKSHTAKPVVNVGRFNSPDTMVDVINSGQCDIIGAARAAISDPFLPEKVRSGSIEDIRECIGCNICVSRDIGMGRIQCTQNATIGEEFRRGWNPELFIPAANKENDVLVIGSGPAGMECAMVLGKRGLRNVHLVDSASVLGGSINWVSKLPGRHEWRRLIEYREHQLSKLKNVEVILNAEFNAEEALDYGAGIIIAATGSYYTHNAIDPHSREPFGFDTVCAGKVLTPEQILRDDAFVGRRVLVVDADGYFMGPGLAELLAKNDHQVTLVTRGEHIGEYLRYTRESSATLRDLYALNVEMLTQTMARPSASGGVRLTSPLGEEVREFDSIVLVGPRVPEDGIYKGLRRTRDLWAENEISAVYRIGDSVRPHLIAEAIFSGHRLAREIDNSNPALPLPFIRERRIIGTESEELAFEAAALSVRS
ncbi:FAD-dependent oxidoreductase [Rothia sp. AR01]|uniref:FAD-dependent oxidoreductase n=1 Tax=Rothia santali TaxID=2949643 RepID=A0A9X2HCQ0_9MICC|nr:FAD-dependent oxidoreductase [Rothia santali]MCP3426936.1 FAD-dependent oxidoreductase [Rothia santali]